MTKPTDEVRQVVAAIIVEDDRILLTQRTGDRSYPWTWECPGGKVEPGESAVVALARELHEELGISTAGIHSFPFSRFTMKPPEVERPFVISFHVVRRLQPARVLLLEVAGAGWFTYDEMKHLTLCPGNVLLLRAFSAYGRFPARWPEMRP